MNCNKNYYIYVFLNSNKPGKYRYEYLYFDFEPFYIGKGIFNRMNNSMFDKKTFKSSIIKSIINKGGYVIRYKLYEGLENIESIELEKKINKVNW